MSSIEIYQKGECVMLIDGPSHSIGVHGYMGVSIPKIKLEVRTINPCKCGSNDPIVDRIGIGPGWTVFCPSCGAEGPIGNYPEEAIFLWNKEKDMTDYCCEKDKKYKPFSTQFRECDKNGNIFRVTCPLCDRIIIVCQKHKTHCHSKACLPDRVGD